MRPRFTLSETVRIVRVIRNDGTYVGLPSGALLMRRGSIGYAHDWGVFSQDQIIHQTHFPDCDRVVGCRGQELVAGGQSRLAGNLQCGGSTICQTVPVIQGKMVVSVGQLGHIGTTGRGEHGDGYIADFGGRWFQIPVSVLTLAKEEE